MRLLGRLLGALAVALAWIDETALPWLRADLAFAVPVALLLFAACLLIAAASR